MVIDPLQQQTVGEFILENEGNLGIAVEVARAFPPIQRQAQLGMAAEAYRAMGMDFWLAKAEAALRTG